MLIQPQMRPIRLVFAIAVLGASLSRPSAVFAKNPGDSVFSGLQVHIVNLKFDGPWSVIEPILKANKENEVYIPASVEINCIPAGRPGCVIMDSVGVRHKGNSTFSESRAKNPFRLSFDEYGIDQRWDGLKGVALHNAWIDPAHMNEKIHLDFALRAGIPGPRANFASLYINDTLYAFYSLVELVDKTLLQTRFREKDGDLFKANDLWGDNPVSDFARHSPFDLPAYQSRYEYKSDSAARGWNRLRRLIDTLNLAADIASALPRIANVDALYRGLGTDNLFNNTDSYAAAGQNFHFYFPEAGGPMEWIIWDVSLSMASSNPARALTETNESRPLAFRFMKTPALREDYLRALWFLYNAYFAGNRLRDRIDTVAEFIRPHVAADTRKFASMAAFEADLDSLKNFIAKRQNFIMGPSGFSSSENGNISAANAIRIGDVVISEIAAAQGWVEVRNQRAYSIDLSGHSLSDDASLPGKWTFPSESFVEPGGYRVIALQGASIGTSGPAGFTLSSTGGFLRFSRANGTVVDSVTFGAQKEGRTVSRFGTGFGDGVATPGMPNVDATIPVPPPPPVVINEFMADNDTLTAPVGLKADWVELRNTTTAAVSLAGMYLSDNRSNPSKWQFPAGTTIPANGHLVVWAYDTTFPGALHASWALSGSGEHIRLSKADLSVIDSLSFGEQARNRTMARLPDGTGAFQSSCLPTLGTANTAACGTTGLVRGAIGQGGGLELSQGGPGRTVARFALAVPGRVRLTVHDLRGREAALLADGRLPAGPHAFAFEAASLPVGVYFFRLRSAGIESVRVLRAF